MRARPLGQRGTRISNYGQLPMALNNLTQWQRAAERFAFALYNTPGYIQNCDTSLLKGQYADRHGSQVIIRKPPRFITTNGDAPAVQGITEETVTATIQPPVNIMINPQGAEIPLILGNKLDLWYDRVAVPMASQVAQGIDLLAGQQIQRGVANFVGTPGAQPATLANIGAASLRMNQLGIPVEDRVLLLNPGAHASVFWGATGLTSNFVTEVIGEAEMTGKTKVPITQFSNIKMTQNTPSRTVGTYNAGAVVFGAGQSGASLISNGWTAGNTLNEGDVITIANVNLVNWQSRQSQGVLQPFVVTANCIADAAGQMNPVAGGTGIPVYPPINPPVGGLPTQFQTVDSFPAAGAAITVLTGVSATVYQESAAIQKQSIGVASIELPEYLSAEYCKTVKLPESWGANLSVRMWLGPDIFNNGEYFRIDWQGVPGVLFRPEGIVRLTS